MPRQTWGPPPKPKRRLDRPGRVELVGSLPALGIAVGGADAEVQHGTLRQVRAVEVDVLGHPAGEHRVGRHPADRLLDHRLQQLAVLPDSFEQLGPLEQRGERDAHLLPRRARPGQQQQHGERVDLRVRQPMRAAVLVGELGLDEHADEVVLGLLTPGGDDRREVRDQRHRVGEGRSHLERLLDRDAEAARDREHRDRRAEVDVQLGPAVGDDDVDQGVDGLLDPPPDPPLRLGRHEGRLDQRPVAAVLRAAHHQEAALVADIVDRAVRRIGRGREHRVVAVHRVAGRVAERREVRALRERQAVEHRLALVAGELVDRAGVHRRLRAELVPDRIGVVGVVAARVHRRRGAKVEQLPDPVAVECGDVDAVIGRRIRRRRAAGRR